MRNRYTKQELPSWHRKAQRGYRVNRVIIILQMVASLAMCGVLVYGMVKLG
ncbi:MAG: hypothetical protein HUK19_06445 [Fibrobacter sp.]|nr:hypothetical protein [Fibrobacter sp.]